VVEGLRVELDSGQLIVDDVWLTVQEGHVLGIVGESGSGKTTIARAALGYANRGATISAGRVVVRGKDILQLGERDKRRQRGTVISHVPQATGNALNPSLRIGRAIRNVTAAHARSPASRERIAELLEQVGLPYDRGFMSRFPHQLSGGQQQRVSVAMALANDARIVVLDEPTTGLDVITQARILTQLTRLRDAGVAMIYVSHDLAVIAQVADAVAVVYGGSVVETGPTQTVLTTPRHPYTQGLLEALPDHRLARRPVPLPGRSESIRQTAHGCVFMDRCAHRISLCEEARPPVEEVGEGHSVRCVRWQALGSRTVPGPAEDDAATKNAEPLRPVVEVVGLRAVHEGRGGEVVVAAHDVSFTIQAGACVALVGESGSGKTTIARTLAGLHRRSAGEVKLLGHDLPALLGHRSREQLKALQMVFQNPRESLNPRQPAVEAIARSGRALRGLNKTDAHNEAMELLDAVRLSRRLAGRYPWELSGGQCQRVSIARALAAAPAVLVCDEVTSALDVSVQATILDMLRELQAEREMAVLLITHDIGVVACTADHVIVLENGRLCESGDVHQVIATPSHSYTKALIAAAPSLGRAMRGGHTVRPERAMHAHRRRGGIAD
jgi:peptide/nickel transport system ATP-binding protein